jgi:thiol:disulfide interchange protein DsbC
VSGMARWAKGTKMTLPTKAMLAAALSVVVGHAFAAPDEARVLAAVRKAYPGTSVDKVVRTPMYGIYAVRMGENVAFVTAQDTRYMVFGRMVDLKAMRDVTGIPRLKASTAPDDAKPDGRLAYWSGPLPVADAITVIRGSGKRILSVFTDPACGFCRQLEQHLNSIQDVTIHYFLLPFQGRDMPMAIWCAPDRAAAYRAAMGDQPLSTKTVACAHPLDRNLAFATRLKVGATPTLLFADGYLVPGLMSANQLEAKLGAAAANPAIKERK